MQHGVANNTPILLVKDIMSRKKKVKNALLAKHKKANAKLHKSSKPKYISKAEQAKIAEQTQVNSQGEQ